MLRELAAAGPLLRVKKGPIYNKEPSLIHSVDPLWRLGAEATCGHRPAHATAASALQPPSAPHLGLEKKPGIFFWEQF